MKKDVLQTLTWTLRTDGHVTVNSSHCLDATNSKKRKFVGNQSVVLAEGRRRIVFPRIPKRDIRWEYSVLFNSAMNTADRDAISNFIFKHCSASCSFRNTLPYVICRMPPVSSFGVPNVANGLANMVVDTPDICGVLLEYNIVRRSDSPKCVVTMSVRLNGHKMVSIPYRSKDPSELTMKSGVPQLITKIVNINVLLTTSLFLDESNRIEEIHWEGKLLK